MRFSYPLKHWLTTLAMAPIIFIGYDYLVSLRLMFDGTGLFLIFISLGLVLSLPVFLLYLFMFNWIIRRINSELIIKTTLDVAGILAIVITFVLLIQGELAVTFAICYSIALLVGSLIFKIGPGKMN